MSSQSFLESLKLFLWWWCSRVLSLSLARALMRVVLLRLIKIFIRGYDSLSLSRSFACACARVAVDKLICYRLYARCGLRASAYVFSLFLSSNNTSASSTCPRRLLVCAKREVARGGVDFAFRVSPRRTSTSRRRFLRFWRERESFLVRIREVLIAYRESSRLFREARRVFRAT